MVLLAEMTRDEIADVAPDAVAVLPTASIEQHGPHLPVITDTTLCGTVAERAATIAADDVTVLVAPVLCYGNSHHHRPFAGVLSLSSGTYMNAVTEILEGLVLSGFRKLIVLNGHGGNTDSNNVVGLDFVHRLGHPVEIATGAYWDIARPALVEKGLIANGLIPGHAGCFETAMMMALRPDLVNEEGLGKTCDVSAGGDKLFGGLTGATVQHHGAWASGTGYTDHPATATPVLGSALLDVIVEQVSKFLSAFALK